MITAPPKVIQTMPAGLARAFFARHATSQRNTAHPSLQQQETWNAHLQRAQVSLKPTQARPTIRIDLRSGLRRLMDILPGRVPRAVGLGSRTSSTCSLPAPHPQRSLPTIPKEVILHNAVKWAAAGDARVKANVSRVEQFIEQAERSNPQIGIEASAARLNRLLSDAGSDFRVGHLRNAFTVAFRHDAPQLTDAIKNGHLTWQEQTDCSAYRHWLLAHLAKKAPTEATRWLNDAKTWTHPHADRADRYVFLYIKGIRNLGRDTDRELDGLYLESRDVAARQGLSRFHAAIETDVETRL